MNKDDVDTKIVYSGDYLLISPAKERKNSC
jgi:hypothetical protein